MRSGPTRVCRSRVDSTSTRSGQSILSTDLGASLAPSPTETRPMTIECPVTATSSPSVGPSSAVQAEPSPEGQHTASEKSVRPRPADPMSVVPAV